MGTSLEQMSLRAVHTLLYMSKRFNVWDVQISVILWEAALVHNKDVTMHSSKGLLYDVVWLIAEYDCVEII